MANRLLNSVFVFQLGGIGSACWWHDAVFAQINNHLPIVIHHVPDTHYAEAQAGLGSCTFDRAYSTTCVTHGIAVHNSLAA